MVVAMVRRAPLLLFLSFSCADAFSFLPASALAPPTSWTAPGLCSFPSCSRRRLQSPQMNLQDSILSEYLRLPEERVMKAVEKAGYRALPQDVATIAGIDLGAAQAGLQNLASLSGGELQVTGEGELVYAFPRTFRASLAANSQAERARAVFKKVWPAIFYGIRVGFGVVLLASIFLIFSTIFVLLSSGNNSEDDRRRGNSRGGGGGMSFSPSFYFGPSPFDFFFYRPYYGYYNMPISVRPRDPAELGFLESVFSYVFGDGDQERSRESERLRIISTVIKENGGALTAEQLAPYLDPPSPRESNSVVVDESFVLPVVTALRGVPRVTDDGDIIYVFPELQTSAAAVTVDPMRVEMERMSLSELQGMVRDLGLPMSAINGYDKVDLIRLLRGRSPPVPQYVEEEPLTFSVAKEFNRLAAAALGILNLGGALFLGGQLSSLPVGTVLPSYLGLTQSLYPLLLVYAITYNVIPLVRSIRIKQANERVEKFNSHRRQWAALLADGGQVVRRKLEAARKFAKDLKVLGNDDVAYTTAKSLAEQNNPKQDPALEAFDRRLQ
jgi:hypothetical protein